MASKTKDKRQTAPDKNHEQQPADETIAAGEHMDLDAMDDAVRREQAAGVTNPTGVILGTSSPNPNMSEEMQGMELESKTFGPPQYGSPDPASAASRLMTLEDGHPLEGLSEGTAAISEDYAAQFSAEIDATDDAIELAQEHNVNLTRVEGTGKDGKITKSDVQKVVKQQEEAEAQQREAAAEAQRQADEAEAQRQAEAAEAQRQADAQGKNN